MRAFTFASGTLLSLSILVGSAFGQTPFNITSFSLPASGTNSTYTTAIVSQGSGTATFTGLASSNATVTATGISTRERGLNCGAYSQVTLTFAFNATDSLTILTQGGLFGAGTSQTLTFNVTGGTGAYSGKGGSGTFLASLSETGTTALITGTGSGTLTSQLTPAATILPSGIVPVFSSVPMVQVGSWISVYGTNMANATALWNGTFPTTLGGVTLTIDNLPAPLWFVSSGQINAQVPNVNVVGCVNVVLTTPNGTVNSQITIQPAQPSFSLLNSTYVVGEIPDPNGSGAYGSGLNSYDLVGPSGAFSFSTRPVKVGETVVLFGVGFGPTQPNVPAAQAYSGAAPAVYMPSVTIGGKNAQVAFAGEIGAGLYQLNVVIPQVASGDQQIIATVPLPTPVLFSSGMTQNCQDPDPEGSMPTSCAIYITVQ
jgi:uncharacterized protein (TIGR03437 family)